MTIAEKLIWTFRKPLGKLLSGVRELEKQLGPEDDWVEDDRRYVYEAADTVLRPLGRPAVREKSVDDWTYTAGVSPDEVEEIISNKYQRNLLSTRKYRVHDEAGKQWAAGSFVYDPPTTDWQHHIYIFPAKYGGTDIYAHKETTVRKPYGHVTDEIISGDPDDILADVLDNADIEYTTNTD